MSTGIAATPAASTATTSSSKSSRAFSTPSFVSPAPATGAAKAQAQHTLSAGIKKKQKRKLDGELQRAASGETPTGGFARKKKKLSLPSSSSSSSSARLTPQLQQLKLKMTLAAAAKKAKKPLQDISNSRAVDAPTRKLDFTPTPIKAAAKQPRSRPELADADASSESSSSSDSSDSSSDSGYSSDEAEVAFDAVTLGNTRVVREGESPSAACASSSLRPAGVEHRFSVSSTVSSIAVAPDGRFLVVGFYNGTIYLYPLGKDAFRFRGGVLLDHITARGMYTQLMVRVALPDDGKFIFAGVYRGSTEIRAFEVDSIMFPSSAALASKTRARDSDDEDGDFGAPHAQAVTHTFSDPKLKGFGAVKSVVRSKTRANEYHLLCGLGIKNVHLWRFFQQPATQQWSWECVFDKQANGISLEYLSFHPSEPLQIISKSEHQNLRVWTLAEELHDDDFATVTLTKQSHVDVKNTVDATAVYGDYAYGGSEALALIDLRSASRMELDLPLSTTEHKAQLDAAAASQKHSARITASMRQRNSRRRGVTTGAEELGGGMRHMRTVSQVAGRECSPFTIGMCSDGSVFLHQPRSVLGMATPLEYVEGYERFFQDPSLSFQAQFSDLTRVNTSGLLSVLPLPATDKEDWMVVAANQDQLLVRSLKAFLGRNQHAAQPSSKAKRGAASSESSSSSSSDSSSDSEGELAIVLSGSKPVIKPVTKSVAKQETPSAASKAKKPSDDRKRAKSDGSTKKASKATVTPDEKAVAADGATTDKDRKKAVSSLAILSDQAVRSTPLVVTTPKRSTPSAASNPMTPYHSVASPVVSVTSLSSGASNPNTPEAHAKLSQRAKQLLVLKDLEWTPPPKAASSSKEPREDKVAAAVGKPIKSRSKTLFSDLVGDVANDDESAKASVSKAAKRSSVAIKASSKQATSTKSGVVSVGAAEDTASTKKAVAAAARRERAAAKKRTDSSRSVVVADKEEAGVTPDDVEMAASDGEVDDADADDELEFLEANEPEFVTTPLLSDGGSLLAASLFQFAPLDTKSRTPASAGAAAARDPRVLNEQATLLLQFAEQNERLQRNFFAEKERVFRLHDCACASSATSALRKKAADASGGVPGKANWKKALASDFGKRKQLKRRQKKQIALKLRVLHSNYRAQIRELLAVQKLQANALTARHKFAHLHQQLQHQQAEESDSSPLETPSAPDLDVEPQPLSISFPYLRLLASLSSAPPPAAASS